MTQLELIRTKLCPLATSVAWECQASTSPFSPHEKGITCEYFRDGGKSCGVLDQCWTAVVEGHVAAWVDPWTQSHSLSFQSQSAKGWSGIPGMSQYGQAVNAECLSPQNCPSILSSTEQQEASCSNSSLAPQLESGGIIHPSVAGPKGHHCPDTSVQGQRPIPLNLQGKSRCVVAPAQPRALHFSSPSQFLVVMVSHLESGEGFYVLGYVPFFFNALGRDENLDTDNWRKTSKPNT